MIVDPTQVAAALTLLLLVVAVGWDLRTRRIPNWLTLPLSLAGLLLHALAFGSTGLIESGLGWLAGLSLLLVPCLLRWVGAGDVKLLAAIGSLQGPALVLRAGLYGVLAGGLLSAAVLMIARSTRQERPARRATLPYGPALALGTVIALVLR